MRRRMQQVREDADEWTWLEAPCPEWVDTTRHPAPLYGVPWVCERCGHKNPDGCPRCEECGCPNPDREW